MANGPIDIVVPWVNPDDTEWRKQFADYKTRECGIKSECRYRDFGLFKYCVKGALENCPWMRNLVIVLAYASQIPGWLAEMAKTEPKIRIVFHSDYIPKQFLPTFNSNVIEMFYLMIPGLADNFIAINDDMYFTRMTKDTDFFVDNVPVDQYEYISHERWAGAGYFDCTQRNNHAIVHRYLNTRKYIKDYHVAIAHSKPMWINIWSKYAATLLKSLVNSRFRKNYNVTHWMFRWANILSGKFVNRKITNYEKYYVLSDGQRFNNIIHDIFTKKIVCLNDQDALTIDTCSVAKSLNQIFNQRFDYEA